jgi:predicted phage baseplate assembly protein
MPAPDLDDRRFQDIVDEAKRRIARLCPGWTDHNVSDPGVALIELFAWMTEMIIYRLNQVPDRLYVKFLELIGITLRSASPARTRLLFTLNGPAREPMLIPRATRVGTERDLGGDQVVFMTDEDLRITVPRLVACRTRGNGVDVDATADLRSGAATIAVFPALAAGDALYLGFDAGLGGQLLRLDMSVTGARGAGIDPDNPPLAWQSWTGGGWRDTRILADTTGGFNRTGQVEMLPAAGHEELAIGNATAFWVRCVLRPDPDKAGYQSSPTLRGLDATVWGAEVPAHHAEPAPAETVGTSDGRPGQTFVVRRAPVLPRRHGETVQVHAGDDQEWTEVTTFAGAGPDDRHFTWEGSTGEIRFGPQVTDRHGIVRQYGAVPPENARIAVTGYRYGGGQRGNVGAGKLTVPLSAIPQVTAVRNLEPATGGVDPETLENAKVRGPLELRAGGRAVTAADFERLAGAVAGIARTRCLRPDAPGTPVRLLVVPAVPGPPRALGLHELKPSQTVYEQLRHHLDGRRLLTCQLRVEEPRYQGIRVRATVRGTPTMSADAVRAAAEEALYAFINPVTGGSAGTGWPFDRNVTIGDIYGVLNAVPGVNGVSNAELVRTDLWREHADSVSGPEVVLVPDALPLSDTHLIEVVQ